MQLVTNEQQEINEHSFHYIYTQSLLTNSLFFNKCKIFVHSMTPWLVNGDCFPPNPDIFTRRSLFLGVGLPLPISLVGIVEATAGWLWAVLCIRQS